MFRRAEDEPAVVVVNCHGRRGTGWFKKLTRSLFRLLGPLALPGAADAADATVATEVKEENKGLERVVLVAICAGLVGTGVTTELVNMNCELNTLKAGLMVGLEASAAVGAYVAAESGLAPKVNLASFPGVVEGAVVWASEEIEGAPKGNAFAEIPWLAPTFSL